MKGSAAYWLRASLALMSLAMLSGFAVSWNLIGLALFALVVALASRWFGALRS